MMWGGAVVRGGGNTGGRGGGNGGGKVKGAREEPGEELYLVWGDSGGEQVPHG